MLVGKKTIKYFFNLGFKMHLEEKLTNAENYNFLSIHLNILSKYCAVVFLLNQIIFDQNYNNQNRKVKCRLDTSLDTLRRMFDITNKTKNKNGDLSYFFYFQKSVISDVEGPNVV